MRTTVCPNCGNGKDSKLYLCRRCWLGLSVVTRKRLWKKDDDAMKRLYELYEQIRNDVPLSEIQVGE